MWLNIVMNYLIPGVHFTDITRDKVCLVYSLMMKTEINIGVILKYLMRKAVVHCGRRYAFEICNEKGNDSSVEKLCIRVTDHPDL